VRFGLFDWLDESGRGQGETYEERLRMLELADRAGFYAYHLAEHHATELSTVPSPNLFGNLTLEQTLASVDLFVRDVMPALAGTTAALA
jgi:hypothetical protein